MHKYRTHKCNELNVCDINKEVKLSGFVKTIRDLGSVVFIDLRDHFGITQLVANSEETVEAVKKIPIETTICVSGKVLKREEDNYNPAIKTGEIEVLIKEVQILGEVSKPLPFKVEDSRGVREDLRLEYRFLDLRNEKIHDKITFRANVLRTLRNKMDALDFVEIQTPILTSSSPEGARDFLVPSRLHKGEFYALPQAPQQFKQLLMISGFDKYYQIAPCFRDEDPRADRSPGEFYQLDLEMAFATQEDVFEVLESVIGETFKELSTKQVSSAPFKKIKYKEAIDIYGTDKPDLRNPLVLMDVTEAFKNTEFKIFKDKTIKALKVNASEVTRKFFDDMGEYAVSELGLKGLAWIKYTEDNQVSGPISRFVTPDVLEYLKVNYDLKENEAMFFVADEYSNACKYAGEIRNELGKRLDLINKNEHNICFIVDFPMYELDDNGKIEFSHNPFSMPIGGLETLNTMNPLDIEAYQYDLVCDGYEIASGAVRNHEVDVMLKAFEIAGYSREDVETKFSSLFNAFCYGAPPHAGAAPGIDRIVMLLCEEKNIREVIAFPKNSKARDVLMKAPSFVPKSQLDDVHIQVLPNEKENKKQD